jgi:hypothetical protein
MAKKSKRPPSIVDLVPNALNPFHQLQVPTQSASGRRYSPIIATILKPLPVNMPVREKLITASF